MMITQLSIQNKDTVMAAPSVDDVNYKIFYKDEFRLFYQDDENFSFMCDDTYLFRRYNISDLTINSVLFLKKHIPDELIKIVFKYMPNGWPYELNISIIKKINFIPKYVNVQLCDKQLLKHLKFSRIVYKYFDLPNTREDKLANLEKIIMWISIKKDRLIPTNPFQFYNVRPLQLEFSRFFVQFN